MPDITPEELRKLGRHLAIDGWIDGAKTCQSNADTIERQAARIAELEREANSRLCASCFETHPIGSMCPPPEVRTTGQAWFRERVREKDSRIAALEKQVAELTGAMAAQDEREREAGASCGVLYELHGCDWPDGVATEVTCARRRIAALEAENERLQSSLKARTNERDHWYGWVETMQGTDVVTNNRIAALEQQVAHLCSDAAELDSDIRTAAKRVLPAEQVDGDSVCVPPLAEVVEAVVGKMRGEASTLRELWLPCDQTVQCAICLWVDWDYEGNGPHSDDCPLGYIENQRRSHIAELEGQVAELRSVVQQALNVERQIGRNDMTRGPHDGMIARYESVLRETI